MKGKHATKTAIDEVNDWLREHRQDLVKEALHAAGNPCFLLESLGRPRVTVAPHTREFPES